MQHVTIRFVVTTLPVIQSFIERRWPGAILCSSQITLKHRPRWNKPNKRRARGCAAAANPRTRLSWSKQSFAKRLMFSFRTLGSGAVSSEVVKAKATMGTITGFMQKRRTNFSLLDRIVCIMRQRLIEAGSAWAPSRAESHFPVICLWNRTLHYLK